MQFTKYSAKTFSGSLNSMIGISKKTVEEHLKLYQGYVTKYNEISEKLSMLTDDDYAKANQAFSMIRELKVELTFAWGGIVNHEIYFAHLGGKRLKIAILGVTEDDFGADLSPGTAFMTPDNQLAIKCGSGSVLVKTLQVEGKKELSANEFLRGYQGLVGSVLH